MRCVHLGWLVIFALLLMADLSSVAAQVAAKAPGLQSPPEGWTIVRELEVSQVQLGQFSKKLNAPLTGLFNTFVRFDNKDLQINTLTTTNSDSAARLRDELRKGKSNRRWVVQNENHVYEFIVQRTDQALLAARARYAFPIQPSRATYHVDFDAVPIAGERPGLAVDDRNRLFNLLLQPAPDAKKISDIGTLAKRFEFSNQLDLVSDLQGGVIARWSAQDSQVQSIPNNSEMVRLRFAKTVDRLGLPTVHLSGEMAVDVKKVRAADRKADRANTLAASQRFPVAAPELKSTIDALIIPTDNEQVKLRKLLDWFIDPKNMRYDGLTGSRYGTINCFKQRFGRCWDYSDLFVTMSRMAGLPCRQVYGWLYESEGHVWCDVLMDGHWQMVDPTTGAVCGSDYLPFYVSESGEFPMVYASLVSISAQP